LATKRIAVRVAIVALVVGAVLIVLGAMEISESGPEAYPKSRGPLDDPALIGYVFDVAQLVTGIILTLAGTATISASLTYLLFNRKRKGV
jgi:hypothetical protein